MVVYLWFAVLQLLVLLSSSVVGCIRIECHLDQCTNQWLDDLRIWLFICRQVVLFDLDLGRPNDLCVHCILRNLFSPNLSWFWLLIGLELSPLMFCKSTNIWPYFLEEPNWFFSAHNLIYISFLRLSLSSSGRQNSYAFILFGSCSANEHYPSQWIQSNSRVTWSLFFNWHRKPLSPPPFTEKPSLPSSSHFHRHNKHKSSWCHHLLKSPGLFLCSLYSEPPLSLSSLWVLV